MNIVNNKINTYNHPHGNHKKIPKKPKIKKIKQKYLNKSSKKNENYSKLECFLVHQKIFHYIFRKSLHILNNDYWFNGLKGSTKMKIENHYSNINHISKIFKVMGNDYVKQRGMKMLRNNKIFP